MIVTGTPAIVGASQAELAALIERIRILAVSEREARARVKAVSLELDVAMKASDEAQRTLWNAERELMEGILGKAIEPPS